MLTCLCFWLFLNVLSPGGVNALQREPEKPKITVETKEQEVSIGGSAMLELKVEGSPKPEVAW